MRIALVHSFYRGAIPSGENQAVIEQAQILGNAGHDVVIIQRHTDDEKGGLSYSIRAAVRVITTRGPDPCTPLQEFGADICHIHNLFPNFGTRWIKQTTVPVVSTLHNFRAICANGLFFRNGHKCTDCLSRTSLSAVLHRCYRDSAVASLPLAIRTSRGPGQNPVLSDSRHLICLSQRAKRFFEEYGVPRDRLSVIPNAILPKVSSNEAASSNGRWLFAGRLSREKGILELSREWPNDLPLDVVGDGPLREQLEHLRPDWSFRGSRSRPQLLSEMPGYTGLVFPSTCFEMQPTVVVEALSVGLPVAALQGNAGAEIVASYGGGVVYEQGGLQQGLATVLREDAALRSLGRKAFEENFSPSTFANALTSLYESVLSSR